MTVEHKYLRALWLAEVSDAGAAYALDDHATAAAHEQAADYNRAYAAQLLTLEKARATGDRGVIRAAETAYHHWRREQRLNRPAFNATGILNHFAEPSADELVAAAGGKSGLPEYEPLPALRDDPAALQARIDSLEAQLREAGVDPKGGPS